MKRLFLSLIGAGVLGLSSFLQVAVADTIADIGFTYTPQIQCQPKKAGGACDKMIQPAPGTSADGTDDWSAGHKFGFHHNFTDKIEFSTDHATQLVVTIVTWGSIVMGAPPVHFTGNGSFTWDASTELIGSGVDLHGYTGSYWSELLTLNTAGDWLLTLTGTACSCAGYIISFADPAALTPIPATLLLFLTGLGGIGFLGWRRKAASLTAA